MLNNVILKSNTVFSHYYISPNLNTLTDQETAMTYVVFFAIILLITLLASYLLIESNRKKTLEAKKKRFNERVLNTHIRLKTKLSELAEAGVINNKHLARIQLVVTNFFVVQPYTDENLQKLEDLSALLITTLNEEITKTYTRNSTQQLTVNIQYFIAQLPAQGILFNKTFYYDILPSLIVDITTQEITQDIEIQDDNKQAMAAQNDEQIINDTHVA